MRKPIIIAEVGCNHRGDFQLAKHFIDTAKDFCKVEAVKFQKRTVSEILTPEEYQEAHPDPMHSYGATYGEHREFLEFSIDQHYELKSYCEERGIVYGCSVYDMTSLKEILSLKPGFIKIPSAVNTNFELLEYLAKNYLGLIHLSLGMTTLREEKMIVDFFETRGRIGNLILYACTSGYPVPFEDICLLEIKRIVKDYGDKIYAVGFSGHHHGISLDTAAYTLGATYIERHFTINRTWKGTDHAASLEPDGLRRVNRNLHNLRKTLTYKSKEILDIEIPQREKLKWNRNLNPVSKPDFASVPPPPAKATIPDIKLVLMDVDGVLTDSGMYYADKGDELKKFNTRDGQGIAFLKASGIKTGIITREHTDLVRRRAEKMGIDFLFQGVIDKLTVVKQLLKDQGLSASEVCYIGDDIYDLDTLEFVGLSAVPKDAMASCKRKADYICRSKGGEGCVREVAELVFNKRKKINKDTEIISI